MLKRLLALLVVAAMAITALVGCTSVTTTTAATTTAATTTATTATPSDTAVAEPSAKYPFPWKGDPITLKYFYVDFSYAGMIPDDGKLIDKEFKKLLGNVTIENQSVGWADYGTKLDLYFSSGDIPDIVVAGGDYATKYGASGYLLDFTKYLDYMPNYQTMYSKYPATYKHVGDQILAIEQPRDTTIISREWIANGYYTKQGIKIPTTYDEVYDTCKQVKELNPDCYPLNFNWGGLFLNDFNTSSSVFFNNDTQKWEFGLMSSNFKDYITFMAKMSKEKLINPNQYDQEWTDQQWLSVITDPKAWFLYSGYNEVNALKVPGMVQKEPSFSVEYMLPPKAGSNHVWIPIEAQPGTDTYFIYSSAKTAKPEFLCAFLNYMASDQVGVLVNWGVEGETYKVNSDGTKSFLDKLILPSNPKSGTIDPIKTYSLYPHFMCKQLGTVTKNDFDAMTIFHVDKDCFARSSKYLEYINQNQNAAGWAHPIPTLTSEETKWVADLKTNLSTYVDEQVALFLTGKRDISEWDSFLGEVKKIGDGQKIADLYNSKPQVKLVN